MSAISTHLNLRPYQVAISTDPDLLLRKWRHLGTINAVSHRSAAFIAAADQDGDPTTARGEHVGWVYAFRDYFVHVHLP